MSKKPFIATAAILLLASGCVSPSENSPSTNTPEHRSFPEAFAEGFALGTGVPPSKLSRNQSLIAEGKLTKEELDSPWQEERATRAQEEAARALQELADQGRFSKSSKLVP